MQQTTPLTNLACEVTKPRKLQATRKKNEEAVKAITRLKSTHEVAEGSNERLLNKNAVKPRSSTGKRATSSHRHGETMNSLTTTSSARSKGEVKEIISSVMRSSKKIHNFLEENQSEQNEALGILLNDELFTLSLVTMIANKNPEEISQYVEKSSLNKLERVKGLERQKKVCESIETRISKLIDSRLKALDKFS